MAKKAAKRPNKKAVNTAKRALKRSPKKATAKKAKKKAAKLKQKRSVSKKPRQAAGLISTIPGRLAWSVLVSALSSATGLPSNTFQLNDDLAKYGFYDPESKSRLAQLLRDRHVRIDDEPVIGAQTVGDVEKLVTGKVSEKTS